MIREDEEAREAQEAWETKSLWESETFHLPQTVGLRHGPATGSWPTYPHRGPSEGATVRGHLIGSATGPWPLPWPRSRGYQCYGSLPLLPRPSLGIATDPWPMAPVRSSFCISPFLHLDSH